MTTEPAKTMHTMVHEVDIRLLPERIQRLIDDRPGSGPVIVVVGSDAVPELGLDVPQPDTRSAQRRTHLVRRRRAMGMTQASLAEAIGVETSTVARWERGITDPSPWARGRLCEVLGMAPTEVDALLRGSRSYAVRVVRVVVPDEVTASDVASMIA